jgi:hypothetical protein
MDNEYMLTYYKHGHKKYKIMLPVCTQKILVQISIIITMTYLEHRPEGRRRAHWSVGEL